MFLVRSAQKKGQKGQTKGEAVMQYYFDRFARPRKFVSRIEKWATGALLLAVIISALADFCLRYKQAALEGFSSSYYVAWTWVINLLRVSSALVVALAVAGMLTAMAIRWRHKQYWRIGLTICYAAASALALRYFGIWNDLLNDAVLAGAVVTIAAIVVEIHIQDEREIEELIEAQRLEDIDAEKKRRAMQKVGPLDHYIHADPSASSSPPTLVVCQPPTK